MKEYNMESKERQGKKYLSQERRVNGEREGKATE
jgi:hypothetical protein